MKKLRAARIFDRPVLFCCRDCLCIACTTTATQVLSHSPLVCYNREEASAQSGYAQAGRGAPGQSVAHTDLPSGGHSGPAHCYPQRSSTIPAMLTGNHLWAILPCPPAFVYQETSTCTHSCIRQCLHELMLHPSSSCSFTRGFH